MADPRTTPAISGANYMYMDNASDVELKARAQPDLDEEQKLFSLNGDPMYYENLAMYRKNGYHPIILGEVLPKVGTCENDKSKIPRYRIIQKLGFGAFATVWLARDLLESRYVAIKVCCGVDTPDFSRETSILRHIQHSGGNRPGHNNIITLYEAFIVSGPNGFHECLVTEVIANYFGLGITRRWSNEEIYTQIACAVSLLHSDGIAHGDLHSQNYGVAVPGLEDIDEEDIIPAFMLENEFTPVIPLDPNFPRDTVPAYLTPSVWTHFGGFLQKKGCYPERSSATFKLFDFGRAFATQQPPRHLPGGAPFEVRPPEVIVYDITEGKAGSVWSKEADIWALACMMSEGGLVDQNGFRDFYQRFGATLRVGGPPPREWLQHLDVARVLHSTRRSMHNDPPFASVDDLVEGLSLEADKGWQKRSRGHFTDLIRNMLKTDPKDRLDIGEVLAHPWLATRALE